LFTTREIFYAAVLPTAVALVAMLLAWRPWRRQPEANVVPSEHVPPDVLGDPAEVPPPPPSRNGVWGAPVGIGVGFLAAFALLEGRLPAWPPAESKHFLYYFAALLTVLALLDALVRWPGWLRQETALVASACAVTFLFRSLLAGDAWPAPEAASRVLVMTLVLHAAWTSTELLAARLPRAAMPLVLFVFAAGSGGVILLSGSLVYARLAGALSTGALAAVAVASVARPFTLARGGVTVVVPAVTALLFLAHHYVDPGLTLTNGILLLSALALPWLAELPFHARRPVWARTVLALLLAGAPIVAAGYRARQTFLQMEAQTQTEGEAEWDVQ
jgi:hypothetical protein